MIEINLLPWREIKREKDKKNFAIALGCAALFAVGIIFLTNMYMNSKLSNQRWRNNTIDHEIQILKKQTIEIQRLKKLRDALISRMTIVQNLQMTRILTVHLFDELIKIMPQGVYINKVKRNNDTVIVFGSADSNTNISDLMRNIDSNKWIQNPLLTEIKTGEIKVGNKQQENEFKLSFILKPSKVK